MGTMSRNEHLKWCKQRALDCLKTGGRQNAMTSMLSDLGKHPDTASSQSIGAMLMCAVKTDEEARNFIEGFN